MSDKDSASDVLKEAEQRNDAAAHDGMDTARWLQIQPQPYWHAEAIIHGNAAALRALAQALLIAADGSAAELNEVFASDGEGYSVLIRRVERPADFPDAFYTIEVKCDNFAEGRCTLAHQVEAYRERHATQDAAAAVTTTDALNTTEAQTK